MQNIFWCHNKIYGTDFVLQLILPKIYLTFGQLWCKNRYLFFPLCWSTLLDRCLQFIGLLLHHINYLIQFVIIQNMINITDVLSTSDLLYQYYRYQTICRSFTLQLQTNFHTWIFLFFTNLHIFIIFFYPVSSFRFYGVSHANFSQGDYMQRKMAFPQGLPSRKWK